MKVDLYNQKAEKIKKIDLNDAIFNIEVNPKILSQYTYSYLSNRRESNAQTKDRSEVSGGGKKPWKQKGTGRARFGSSRNPIWVGGGVAFGPTNARNFKKAMTKNFKKAALKHALSYLVKENLLKVVEVVKFNDKKSLAKQGLEVVKAFENPKKLSIVTAAKNAQVMNAFSNLPESKVTSMEELNVYDLLSGGTILIDSEALNIIENKFSK